MCVDDPEETLPGEEFCLPQEDIKEWMKRKFMVLLEN